MTQLYKGSLQGTFPGVAHTRNAPLLSLEGQRHFPHFIGEISFDFVQDDKIKKRLPVGASAEISPRASLGRNDVI